MEVNKIDKAIKDTSYDQKLIGSLLITLTNEEKEELYKWYKDKNEKLKYEVEDYKEKIDRIRNRLYEYRK